jgi:hypothetical protein
MVVHEPSTANSPGRLVLKRILFVQIELGAVFKTQCVQKLQDNLDQISWVLDQKATCILTRTANTPFCVQLRFSIESLTSKLLGETRRPAGCNATAHLHTHEQWLAHMATRVAGGGSIGLWPRMMAGYSDDLGTGRR